MLYKYATWNDSHTKDSINNHKMYFNMSDSFNDPFDIYAKFSIGNRDFLEGLFQNQGTTIDTRRCFTDEQILDYARLMDRCKMSNSRYGITCFSKLCDSILMWAMYADKARGICIGFDISDDMSDTVKKLLSHDQNHQKLLGAIFKIFNINYQETRPTLEYTRNYNIEELLSTKYKDWEYEQEVRIMIRSNREGIFPCELNYCSEYLKTIIIGSMMNVKDFTNFYESIVKVNSNLTYKIAILDKDDYRYNIVDFEQDEMKMLEKNIKYLRNNANRIVCKYDCLKDILGSQSKKKSRKYFQDAVDSIPIYHFKEIFTIFLIEEYDFEHQPYQSETCKQLSMFYNWICDYIKFQVKKSMDIS